MILRSNQPVTVLNGSRQNCKTLKATNKRVGGSKSRHEVRLTYQRDATIVENSATGSNL
jgi:hypothetical protein